MKRKQTYRSDKWQCRPQQGLQDLHCLPFMILSACFECITIKLLKIWTLEKIGVISLKFEQRGFTVEYPVMHPKKCRRNGKHCWPWSDCSVWSGSTLFAQTYLSENLGTLWYFTVKPHCSNIKIPYSSCSMRHLVIMSGWVDFFSSVYYLQDHNGTSM